MLNNYAGRFRDQRWLVAHNAWNTEVYPNQCKTITELLDYGVRGLALDIYGDDEGTLHLQHGHGNDASATKWAKVRAELDAWLKANDDQIVTLFFESYLTGPKPGAQSSALGSLDTSLRGVTGYKPGRSVQEGAIKDKTLTQLVADNHRLFAFIQKKPDEGWQSLFPVMTSTFTENLYGDQSLRIPTWVNLRDGFGHRNELTFMNHFGDAPSGSEWDRNKSSLIKKHAEAFLFGFGGRYPNFISLDYINWTGSRRGPIRAIEDLVPRKDFSGVTSFHWKQSNDFDDVVIDVDDSEKIVDFEVTTTKDKGIVKIKPVRGPGRGITKIELINVPGKGLVDMRYSSDALTVGWVSGSNQNANSSNPANKATHVINGDLLGTCCRTQDGYGVTDFAAAYR